MHPKWKTANEQHMCRVLDDIKERLIPRKGTFTSSLYSNGCMGKTNSIARLEHVRVYITLSHPRRGTLSITLISPSGTKSELLKERDRDIASKGFQNWPFMTVFSWGENPRGNWTLIVRSHGNYEGEFKTWSLILYGTWEDDHRQITAAEQKICSSSCKKNCPVSFGEVCQGCSVYCDCEKGECLRFCDEEDEVDEKARHCLSPLYKGSKNTDDPGAGEMSTFVKWLIIFSLLAVFMATVLIIYLLKVSGKLCWARPIIDKNTVQQNASYAATDSLNNPNGNETLA
jgi:subtilisin-like proprotein convertase family protein